MLRRRLEVLACAAALAASGGCTARGCKSHDAPAHLAIACSDELASVETTPPNLPPFTPERRGEVLRCARGARLAAPQIGRAAAEAQLPGRPFGASVYRFSYRVARATGARQSSAVTAATILIPDRLRDPEALAVYAHGTIGLGEICASTEALPHIPAALAGAGWITVVPDYAGFGFGAAPGWLSAEDEARSLLDTVRAVGRLMPADYKPRRVALFGHSQGGHAVLAAQALARSDHLDAEIVGVVAAAPMWFSPDLLGRLVGGDEPRGAGRRDALWSALYFFGHAELFDGPGQGAALLREDKRDALGAALARDCAAEVEKTLGAEPVTRIFTPELGDELGRCARGEGCSARAATWQARFRADLPELDPDGAPVLLILGDTDANLTPPRARCAIEHARKSRGSGGVEVCLDGGDHHSILPSRGAAALRWLAARDRGGREPLDCEADEHPVACVE